MNNKRSFLGDAVGHGPKRVLVNVVLLIALSAAAVGSAVKIKGGVLDKIFPKPAATAPATQGS